MKTIDLSDLKAGDKAWSCTEGEGIIQETDLLEPWAIRCHNQWYQTNGISGIVDTHPTLFHSEQEFREYWGMESNALTKREQFAMAAMQGLLANTNGAMTEGGSRTFSPDGISSLALKHADALLTKLNETP